MLEPRSDCRWLPQKVQNTGTPISKRLTRTIAQSCRASSAWRLLTCAPTKPPAPRAALGMGGLGLAFPTWNLGLEVMGRYEPPQPSGSGHAPDQTPLRPSSSSPKLCPSFPMAAAAPGKRRDT